MTKDSVRALYTFEARGRTLELGRITRLMGVLNITPDSFSGDGLAVKCRVDVPRAVRRARQMLADGADILDVGGESTRPGASAVPEQEEISRVCPVIAALVKAVPQALISVDTVKPGVAREALRCGAGIVNVVRGTPVAAGMLAVVRRFEAGIVLMHMRGTPRNMQQKTDYRAVTAEVVRALKASVAVCCRAGISRRAIMVDPGIGFAKTPGQSAELIRRLADLRSTGCPVLVGPSRKSFIAHLTGAGDLPPAGRLMGTAAAVVCSIAQGAHLVRVHDVREMKQLTLMADAILYHD